MYCVLGVDAGEAGWGVGVDEALLASLREVGWFEVEIILRATRWSSSDWDKIMAAWICQNPDSISGASFLRIQKAYLL
jgi:hypothetical protein